MVRSGHRLGRWLCPAAVPSVAQKHAAHRLAVPKRRRGHRPPASSAPGLRPCAAAAAIGATLADSSRAPPAPRSGVVVWCGVVVVVVVAKGAEA